MSESPQGLEPLGDSGGEAPLSREVRDQEDVFGRVHLIRAVSAACSYMIDFTITFTKSFFTKCFSYQKNTFVSVCIEQFSFFLKINMRSIYISQSHYTNLINTFSIHTNIQFIHTILHYSRHYTVSFIVDNVLI